MKGERYSAANGAALLFEPRFGWRSLWLQGFPAGLLAALVGAVGRETRGRSLRELESGA